MKDSAKLQREILVQKKENIEKNILNIQTKLNKLQESLDREKQALLKVNRTLDSFGKSNKPKVDEKKEQVFSSDFMRSTAFSE